jgi:ESF2/ABP1 family protein
MSEKKINSNKKDSVKSREEELKEELRNENNLNFENENCHEENLSNQGDEKNSENNQDEQENFDENDSINEEILLDGQGENELVDAENLEDFREKVKKSGVVYISNIPEGMTVNYIRQKFETYGVTRIYLAPENPNHKSDPSKKHFSKKRKMFKEGWVEFSNKLMAKLCEYELNGQVIGGSRNLPFREDIWTIKYLHKFKWHHLIEKMNFNRKLREQRMKAEIAQARREANFIEETFEKSKIVNKKNKKREREELEENFNEEPSNENKSESQPQEVDNRFSDDKFKAFQRNFKQRKPILNNK